MKDFNKIVNKLWNKWWKILFKKDIFELIDPECKKEYDSFVNKLIYKLRAQGILLTLKNGVYILPEKEDSELHEIDLLEKYYLKLLKKYISSETQWSYYISGQKSLEFHLKDYSIPEKIFVVTKNVDKKVKVGNYEIIFKTISWRHAWKKINLFSKFSQFSKKITLDNIDFKISSLELSLLESALVTENEKGLQFDILNKTIKKYGKVLDISIFYEVWKYKYAMSFNRLKEISKSIDTDLYEVFLDVIKKNGNLFIWEGLRGF